METKSAQTSQPSPHMMPANPLYSVQPSSPYLGPGAFPLADLQSYAGHAPRHALSQTLSQSQMLPSISASPPSSFQISPPLHPHQQLSLHQSSLLNQPIGMQQVQSQPIIPHQMGLQASLHSPPPGQQVNMGSAFWVLFHQRPTKQQPQQWPLSFISFRVSPTYSQSTRRALEVPSLQEPLALVRDPVGLTATTGRVNTAIGSVAATAGQCRRSEAAIFAASSLTFAMETDKSASPTRTFFFCRPDAKNKSME